jgi:hypothetical protein
LAVCIFNCGAQPPCIAAALKRKAWMKPLADDEIPAVKGLSRSRPVRAVARLYEARHGSRYVVKSRNSGETPADRNRDFLCGRETNIIRCPLFCPLSGGKQT